MGEGGQRPFTHCVKNICFDCWDGIPKYNSNRFNGYPVFFVVTLLMPIRVFTAHTCVEAMIGALLPCTTLLGTLSSHDADIWGGTEGGGAENQV